MRRGIVLSLAVSSLMALSVQAAPAPQGTQVDQLLRQENLTKKLTVAPVIDDMAFMRRVTIDLIGRIPTEDEIQQYMKAPVATRRAELVDRLLQDPTFADRWTVFFGDQLRIRSGQPGGAALTAFIHKAIEVGMPYDVICRQLISANGKAGKQPEVGFILGDEADPLAMAGVTAQVFMGIRVSCAQCHDHPFDVWTRKEFYGLAAYYGKTQRRESELTRAVYTVETDGTRILWPPEDAAKGEKREPMIPKFPFAMDTEDRASKPIARLVALREAEEARKNQGTSSKGPSLDDLLADAGNKLAKDNFGKMRDGEIDVAGEAKKAARDLQVEKDLYQSSKYRANLADLVTSPKNRYFSRSFVNRLWKELVGHGFVEPVDDFSEENTPSHPKTLDYLADEFVASGFDLRSAIRSIVTSQAYQRGHVEAEDLVREEAEKAFVATPVRRMISESLLDSMVLAGHLFDVKHLAGENTKTITTIVREAVKVVDGKPQTQLASITGVAGGEGGEMKAMGAMTKMPAGGGYDLESAIEVNFDSVLMKARGAPEVEAMAKMSNEEIEANEMMAPPGTRTKYIEKRIQEIIDDNPKFASSMRMNAPAAPSHFLRVFGQTSRDALGEFRDHDPTMRQALMMLNGRVTNEAARVGKLEPMYALLVGPKADQEKAIRLAYREILTREPAADEIADAKAVLSSADTALDGMADLRWALFNCHEFRYIP